MSVNYKTAFEVDCANSEAPITNDVLREIRDIFVNNCNHQLVMGQLPIIFAQLSYEFQAAKDEALRQTAAIDSVQKSPKRRTEKEILALRNKLLRPYYTDKASIPSRTEAYWKNFDQIVEVGHEAIQRGVQSVFRSLVTQTWTAFEVLCGDAWEAMLNIHPQGLAELKGDVRAWKLGEQTPQNQSSGSKDGKKIDFDWLQKNGYDLRNSMGTVLKKRFRFTILDGIRLAYATAFHANFVKIRQIIMDRCFHNLSAVRNVIIHKAARIDDEFMDQMSKSDMFPNLKLGDILILNGMHVQQLVKPTLQQTGELIIELDRWLLANSKTETNESSNQATSNGASD